MASADLLPSTFLQHNSSVVARQVMPSSGARPRTVRLGGACSRAAWRLRGYSRAPEMVIGDREVVPSGSHCRCASVKLGSVSKDEVKVSV